MMNLSLLYRIYDQLIYTIIFLLFTALLLTTVESVILAESLLPKKVSLHITNSEDDIFLPLWYEHPAMFAPIDTRWERTLKDYYSRRQYPGSPPIIPHIMEADSEKGGMVCLSCHENGGFVHKFDAYSPITPHPNFIGCEQCHVKLSDVKTFKDNEWKSIKPPFINRPTVPGSPPPMSHELQMRTNCLACHAGAAAIKEVRTPHPYRLNCLQCHVKPKNVKVYNRKPKK